jgi:hypothetical protein
MLSVEASVKPADSECRELLNGEEFEVWSDSVACRYLSPIPVFGGNYGTLRGGKGLFCRG